jgi:glycosyltransferase involved in cell wall biosynthesis
MHWFIVPDLDGPISGGTRFNRLLLEALVESGWPARVLPLQDARPVLACAEATDCFWVDSLYIDQVPALVHTAGGVARVGLLLHYLPSLVARPDGPLGVAETVALDVVDAFLVPSAFMHDVVRRCTRAGRPIVQVEPGRPRQPARSLPVPSPVRAVMVANLLPGKGVAALLTDLSDRLLPADVFQLTIIGGSSLDSGYARRCLTLAEHPALAARVHFTGALPAEETLSRMAGSNLLASASVMESYGMALAEARTLGLPVVAVAGGNVATLVSPASGGEVVADARALGAACVALARDPGQHQARWARAYQNALPAWSWRRVAQTFMVQVSAWVKHAAGSGPEKGAWHDGGPA